MHPTDRPAIEVQSISKTYRVGRQRIQVLTDVSLTVKKGEFVVITGASGSGKSTLLHLIGGLDTPSTGQITIDGQRIDKLRDGRLSRFRNQTIGFVFQSFYLQPFLTLGKNIAIASVPLRMKRRDRAERLVYLAEAVGLSDRLRHKPKMLSGGQIQRAAIARALFNNPTILLADEPTGNLDSANAEAVIALLQRIRNDFGTTIVVISHNSDIAAQADRVITIKDGGIV
ncbi:MAG: ABC transporter ATP-binding protein [Candidatus Saccharimonadales bacterium]